MTAIEKPIFIVAFGASYIGSDDDPERGMICFGRKEDAEAFAREYAEENDVDPAMGRIIQYNFSGEVCEVCRE